MDQKIYEVLCLIDIMRSRIDVDQSDIERFNEWIQERSKFGKGTGKGIVIKSSWNDKFKYLIDRAIDAETKIGKAEEEKIFHANAARDASRIKNEYDAKLQQLIEHTAKLQDTEKNRELPPGI